MLDCITSENSSHIERLIVRCPVSINKDSLDRSQTQLYMFEEDISNLSVYPYFTRICLLSARTATIRHFMDKLKNILTGVPLRDVEQSYCYSNLRRFKTTYHPTLKQNLKIVFQTSLQKNINQFGYWCGRGVQPTPTKKTQIKVDWVC